MAGPEYEQYTVMLTSEMKQAGQDDNNFSVLFNNNIFGNLSPQSVAYLYPQSIQLPYSFYNITPQNNKFHLVDKDDTFHTIELTIGSPSTSTLAAEISEKLQDLGLKKLDGTTDLLISCSFDNTNSFVFSITWNEAGAIKFIDFDTEGGTYISAFALLGFDDMEYDVEADTSLSATHPPDLSPVLNVNIHSNLTTRCFTIRDTVMNNSDILCSIPVKNFEFGNNIYYENPSDNFRQKISKNFSYATFRITDQADNLLNIRGTVEITFKIHVYKPQETLPNMK